MASHKLIFFCDCFFNLHLKTKLNIVLNIGLVTTKIISCRTLTSGNIAVYNSFVQDHGEKMLHSEHSGNGAERGKTHKRDLQRRIPMT